MYPQSCARNRVYLQPIWRKATHKNKHQLGLSIVSSLALPLENQDPD